MGNISTDNFADAINDELKLFEKSVLKRVNESAQKAAKEAVKNLKQNSPKRSGKYASSWKSKKEMQSLGEEVYTVYNKDHYRLTHLLENGHINKKTGTRTKAVSHIAPAEQAAADEFLKGLENLKL